MKTEYQMPFATPKSLIKTGITSNAPSPSKRIVPLTMNSVNLAMSPILGADTASCIAALERMSILRPMIFVKKVVMVRTPMPPIWIRKRMMI